jgi:hypothetical protein
MIWKIEHYSFKITIMYLFWHDIQLNIFKTINRECLGQYQEKFVLKKNNLFPLNTERERFSLQDNHVNVNITIMYLFWHDIQLNIFKTINGKCLGQYQEKFVLKKDNLFPLNTERERFSLQDNRVNVNI